MLAYFGSLKGKTIAVWGLAFKPRTDDMREAPAIVIIEGLLAEGAIVRAHDPEATERARSPCSAIGLRSASKSYDALEGADALAVVTEWNTFREPDFRHDAGADAVSRRLRRPQYLFSRAHARARLHLLLHGPITSRTVLVTGGAGYIGSHAAKALSLAGYRVVVFDNLTAGHREAVKYGDLVVGDITDVAAVADALERHAVSAVMHFAAYLDVGESVREPVKYYRNNVVGALSVLEAMAARSVTQFVFSSTCATYGDPIETPIGENHPQRPINSYGETKLAVERALPHFERAHGIHSVALRYFNAAGADPDGEIGEDHAPEIHLIPRAIEAATGGRGLQVFGDDYPTPDGTCLRDYIHVTDLADAHVRALEALAAAGQLGGLQPRDRGAAFRPGGHRRRRARHRAKGAVDAGAKACRRSRRAVRQGGQSALGAGLGSALFRYRVDCRHGVGMASLAPEGIPTAMSTRRRSILRSSKHRLKE